MSRTIGIFTESSDRNPEIDHCRLCREKHGCFYSIFTSNVAYNITVKDALHHLVGLQITVGDGLPTTMCPLCLKKLTEFSVFKKMCLESDAVLRNSCFRSFEGGGVDDEESEPCVETKDCIQDVIENTSEFACSAQMTEAYIPVPDCLLPRDDDLSFEGGGAVDDNLGPCVETTDCIQDLIEIDSQPTCSAQITEIYIPVPDCPLPRDDKLFHIKDENEDHLSEENNPMLYTTDPAGSDASDPLATDDLSDPVRYKCSSGKEELISDDEGHTLNDCTDGVSREPMHQDSFDQSGIKTGSPSAKADQSSDDEGQDVHNDSTDGTTNQLVPQASDQTHMQAQASTSSQCEEVDAEERGAIEIDLGSMLVLAKKESPKESDATESGLGTYESLSVKADQVSDDEGRDAHIDSTDGTTNEIVPQPLDQASTSSQGEEVDAEGTGAIVIDLDSLLVLAEEELSPKETDATEPSSTENGDLIQNNAKAMESMVEAFDLPGSEKASDLLAPRAPKIRASNSRKGRSKIRKGPRKTNLGRTKEKKNVREERRSFIIDGKTCTDTPHTAKKPYSCSECEKSFYRKSHFARHIRTHTKEKPYSCNECEKSFSERSNLVCHMRIHTKEKPFSCSKCQKSFSQRSSLVRHIRTHTKEKPYSCGECEKSFSRKSTLFQHIRTHTKEKPYSCGECEKSFSGKGNLVQHIRTHTKEKPYSCGECEMSFSHRSNLVYHIRTHTKEKPYSCSECEKSFSRKSNFVLHIRTHTKDKTLFLR